jgi:hypothetical protein
MHQLPGIDKIEKTTGRGCENRRMMKRSNDEGE